MSETSKFPALPDPWADGEVSEELMWPTTWANTGIGAGEGREHGVVRISQASHLECGGRNWLKMEVPGAKPVLLSPTLLATLVQYFEDHLDRAGYA